MELDDSFQWSTPIFISAGESPTPRALLDDAVRRTVDLRDHLAERGDPATTRAVLLMDVLNLLDERLPEQ